VGGLNGIPVVELVTKGGLSMIATAQKGKAMILGFGPIYPIAKSIATMKEPNIHWELSKSEDLIDPRAYLHLVPEYKELTKNLQDLLDE
jgi:hypothetical protein